MMTSSLEDEEEELFTRPWNMSDVLLKVIAPDESSKKLIRNVADDHERFINENGVAIFHVHSMVLSMASRVFEKMLQPNFKEGREKIIELPDQKPNNVHKLLKIIYPTGYTLEDDFYDCEEILKMAKMYDIQTVINYMDYHLSSINVRNQMYHLLLASEYGLPKTKAAAAKSFSDTPFDENSKENSWGEVDVDAKLNIIAGKVRKYCDKCGEKTLSKEQIKDLFYTAETLQLQ